MSSFAKAPEVYVGELGGPAQPMTHYNDDLKPLWGKSESISWTSDAFPVQGWRGTGALRSGAENIR